MAGVKAVNYFRNRGEGKGFCWEVNLLLLVKEH